MPSCGGMRTPRYDRNGLKPTTDFCAPTYGGWSSPTTNIDRGGRDALVPGIFSRRFSLLQETPPSFPCICRSGFSLTGVLAWGLTEGSSQDHVRAGVYVHPTCCVVALRAAAAQQQKEGFGWFLCSAFISLSKRWGADQHVATVTAKTSLTRNHGFAVVFQMRRFAFTTRVARRLMLKNSLVSPTLSPTSTSKSRQKLWKLPVSAPTR